jgi:hypothetical protein
MGAARAAFAAMRRVIAVFSAIVETSDFFEREWVQRTCCCDKATRSGKVDIDCTFISDRET